MRIEERTATTAEKEEKGGHKWNIKKWRDARPLPLDQFEILDDGSPFRVSFSFPFSSKQGHRQLVLGPQVGQMRSSPVQIIGIKIYLV